MRKNISMWFNHKAIIIIMIPSSRRVACIGCPGRNDHTYDIHLLPLSAFSQSLANISCPSRPDRPVSCAVTVPHASHRSSTSSFDLMPLCSYLSWDVKRAPLPAPSCPKLVLLPTHNRLLLLSLTPANPYASYHQLPLYRQPHSTLLQYKVPRQEHYTQNPPWS